MGSPADWQARFVSAYASSHPWEDWAETWAHYLHMTDTLETALACGLSLRPKRSDEPTFTVGRQARSFDQMIGGWFPLTYVLNNLNRGMGLPDGYPFVLSPPVVDKLRFVHEVIAGGIVRSAACVSCCILCVALLAHARSLSMTDPCTSVSRRSMPLWRNVSLV